MTNTRHLSVSLLTRALLALCSPGLSMHADGAAPLRFDEGDLLPGGARSPRSAQCPSNMDYCPGGTAVRARFLSRKCVNVVIAAASVGTPRTAPQSPPSWAPIRIPNNTSSG